MIICFFFLPYNKGRGIQIPNQLSFSYIEDDQDNATKF